MMLHSTTDSEATDEKRPLRCRLFGHPPVRHDTLDRIVCRRCGSTLPCTQGAPQ